MNQYVFLTKFESENTPSGLENTKPIRRFPNPADVSVCASYILMLRARCAPSSHTVGAITVCTNVSATARRQQKEHHTHCLNKLRVSKNKQYRIKKQTKYTHIYTYLAHINSSNALWVRRLSVSVVRVGFFSSSLSSFSSACFLCLYRLIWSRVNERIEKRTQKQCNGMND